MTSPSSCCDIWPASLQSNSGWYFLSNCQHIHFFFTYHDVYIVLCSFLGRQCISYNCSLDAAFDLIEQFIAQVHSNLNFLDVKMFYVYLTDQIELQMDDASVEQDDEIAANKPLNIGIWILGWAFVITILVILSILAYFRCRRSKHLCNCACCHSSVGARKRHASQAPVKINALNATTINHHRSLSTDAKMQAPNADQYELLLKLG